ncbi:hypothetical protein JNUCC42_03805 [Brevibacterium sp. JNUCC-42]|nr:hypothetical protein JNUCC42_03805 [Brevibacterium sp. JNUCC-42]
MNKNDKNKYEIVDDTQNSSPISNRYPLANDPYQKLQNTNYKDWLAMSNNTSLVDFAPYGFTWLNAAVAVLTIVAVTTALLVAGPVVVGTVIAAGLTILAASLPLLWPDDEPAKDNTFNQIMDAVGELIDNKITDLIKQATNRQLDSLRDQINHYKSAFEYWQSNPNNPAAIETVRARFHSVNTEFVGAKSALSMKGYEVTQLGAYAQAARMHLLLLRDGILFADKWNLAKDGQPGDLHYKEFLEYCNEYSNHCSTWYNKGLEEANKNKIGLQFQRLMTISVLDYIALFSSYDPRKYNMPVNTQIFTRTIYTDQQREDIGPSIHKPKLFRYLKNMELHTDLNYGGALVGHRNTFGNMNYELTIDDIQGYDVSSVGERGRIDPIDLSTDCYGVKITSEKGGMWNDVKKMAFYHIGDTPNQYYFNGEASDPFVEDLNIPGIELPSSDLDGYQYTHYLSDGIFKQSGTSPFPVEYIFGWNHRSLNPNGNFVRDAAQDARGLYYQITQVPAVKASRLTNNGSKAGGISVVEGPSFTGGNVLLSNLWLSPWDRDKGSTDMTIKLPITENSLKQRNKEYYIRMYYAANHDHSIVFKNDNTNFRIDFTSTCEKDLEYKEAKFKHFQHATSTGKAKFVSDKVTMCTLELSYDDNVVNLSGDGLWLMIDKIEFIPVMV